MKPLSVVLPTSQPVPENPSKNPQQPGIKKKKIIYFRYQVENTMQIWRIHNKWCEVQQTF